MKARVILFCLCFSCVFTLCARAAVLPAACGNDKTTFAVTTLKNQPTPAALDAGKARIIFLERESEESEPVIARFGMDGAWMGADYGNSYFALTVDPGVHHLCADWQDIFNGNDADLTSFTAEPGKVYYFAANVTTAWRGVVNFNLSQLNDDEGEYRVRISELSTSKVSPYQTQQRFKTR